MIEPRQALLPGGDDTIAAIASGNGRGALAMVRLSGPRAHAIASAVIRPWRPDHRVARPARLIDPQSETPIDHCVVTAFSAPRSYTGEDLVEISVHGGPLVPSLVLSALLDSGARLALPGEFTRRTVLNGKLDIVQAEAVGDLATARSRAGHQLALRQLDGKLSARLDAIRAQVIDLEALLAYDVDFPEEDDGPVSTAQIMAAITALGEALDALLATARQGELLRSGVVVVIAGPPNVGKSTLFNALLESARAIVTDEPGTTRDALEAELDVEGWPLRLVDTAGIHTPSSRVEELGIELSQRWLHAADLVLACGDLSTSPWRVAAELSRHSSAPVLKLRLKADLVAPGHFSSSERRLEDAAAEAEPHELRVSAVTGYGIAELRRAIADVLGRQVGHLGAEMPVLTRERHVAGVARARDEVEAFEHAWREGSLPAVVAAVHLHTAAAALGEVVGDVTVGDVLDRVFSTFCVGK